MVTAMKNIVGVRIYNRPFNLSTDDSEAYIKKIAAMVDEKVKGIVSAAPNTNIIDAAILAALEAVDERQKALSTIDNLRTQIKDYVDDAGEARLKCDEAQKQLRELKIKCDELEKEVEIRRMFNKKLEAEAAVAAAKAKEAEETAKAKAAEEAEKAKKQAEEDAIKAQRIERAAKALEEAKAAAAAKAEAAKTQTRPPITSSSAYSPDAPRSPFKK